MKVLFASAAALALLAGAGVASAADTRFPVDVFIQADRDNDGELSKAEKRHAGKLLRWAEGNGAN